MYSRGQIISRVAIHCCLAAAAPAPTCHFCIHPHKPAAHPCAPALTCEGPGCCCTLSDKVSGRVSRFRGENSAEL